MSIRVKFLCSTAGISTTLKLNYISIKKYFKCMEV